MLLTFCGGVSSGFWRSPKLQAPPTPTPPQTMPGAQEALHKQHLLHHSRYYYLHVTLREGEKERKGAAGGSGGQATQGAGLPMQMPVPALGSALRSQKRPRLSSHGSSREQLSPRWRAHTRQQEQSSSTARTPGAQVGGILGHRAGHWVGQRWLAATWRGRDKKDKALSRDDRRRSDPGPEQGPPWRAK